MEENLKNEEVKKVNLSKEKNTKKKKMMTIIAVIVVLFLGVNVFATTQGYNNIFFIIKNLVSPESANSKAEILSDRDITISYQPIKIFRDLSIQINKLIVEDDEATLYIDVTNDAAENEIDNYVVYDITDGKKELIGNHMAANTIGGRYIEKIKLFNFSNNTRVLQLELFDKEHYKISALEINLDKKEINILTAVEEEIEKISEVELKEFLSNCLKMNYYDLHITLTDNPEEYYYNEIKVEMALKILGKKQAKENEVHAVIKEFCGESPDKTLDLANTIVTTEDGEYRLLGNEFDERFSAMCIDIPDINYSNGIYNVTCVYVFPTEADYRNNAIENLSKYVSTVQIKLNQEYEYSKYYILNIDDIVSEFIPEDNDSDIDEETDKEDIDNKNEADDNTISSNTVSPINPNPSTNTVTNTTVPTNPSDDAVKPNYEKIDNYASTMQWVALYTPGLRTQVPTIWNVEVIDDMYSGEHEDGKLATVVTGLARGINKETNEIIDSNMTIKYYMPDFVDYTNLEDFANSVAQRFNATNTGCGYGDRNGNTTWRLLSKGNSEYYCHFELIDNGTQGIGYVVEVECDNFNNYKVTNILNWTIPDIKTTSF